MQARPIHFIVTEQNKNKRNSISAVVFFAVFLFMLLLSGCEELPSPAEQAVIRPVKKEVNVLHRGVYTDFVLDVIQVNKPEQMVLMRDLLEGLVIFDRLGNIVPAVAESWQTTDNKSWIFTLRPELKWSNGEQLTAHDFVRSWHRLALSESPLKSYLAYLNLQNAELVLAGTLPVEQLGIRALDDYTLHIQLDKSAPYLPKMLAHSALLPHYLPLQTLAKDPAQDLSLLVGNGAYIVTERNDNLFKLEKNPFYRQPEDIAFTQVHYYKIKQNQEKEADVVENPKFDNGQTLYFPQLCTYFYEFNFNDTFLQQSAVRSALMSMISVSDIIQDTKAIAADSSGFLPQNMQFEQEREWQPTLVEQLLQQAGVTEKNPLQLRMTYDNDGVHPILADRLIRAWSQSDLIRIKAEPLSHQQLMEKRIKGDFQLIRSGWCADYNDPTAFLQLLHSQSPDNKSGFSHESIDQLLERSLSVDISEAERNSLYQQIADIAEREKAVLPIFQYVKPIHIDSSIAGYELKNPTEVIYSKDLYRK